MGGLLPQEKLRSGILDILKGSLADPRYTVCNRRSACFRKRIRCELGRWAVLWHLAGIGRLVERPAWALNSWQRPWRGRTIHGDPSEGAFALHFLGGRVLLRKTLPCLSPRQTHHDWLACFQSHWAQLALLAGVREPITSMGRALLWLGQSHHQHGQA